MKNLWKICAATLMAVSCNTQGRFEANGSLDQDETLQHEMIVLGARLENPYVTATVQEAFAELYPTKSRELVSTTDLYVRFLPKDDDEYNTLCDLGVEMLDHPMDYEIVTEGDYYQDPSIGDEAITWQYAVVDKDFEFPDGIQYEIIDECFISDDADEATRAADGVDWDAVEAQAYRITGNEALLDEEALTKATKYYPSGRITLVDDDANGGQPFGLAGVKVSCNSFVKFASAYTDRDGYYTMSKKYSANPRYRIIFKNEKGFSIGFNLIIVTASISTLGKGSPEGVDCTVTKNSNGALFRRSVVTSAAYDYYTRCEEEDMDLPTPPSGLRIWIFKNMEESSTVMIHHKAVISADLIRNFLGVYAFIVQIFAPDITIGAKGCDCYADLYDAVTHELAHASHFTVVGTDYWNKYIWYILSSFLHSAGDLYGDGSANYAGYCEVGEMWGYYLSSVMHKDRYGGAVPSYGSSRWFYPQIFRYLDERGISRSDIFAALQSDVTDRDALEDKLVELYPAKKTVIEQVFNRYK